MKVQSMTGFGKAEHTTSSYHVRVEMKSVNNRFLDIQFKTPKELSELEISLRNRLNGILARGSVICFIQYEDFDKSMGRLKLNRPLADGYAGIAAELGKTFKTGSKIEISDFFKVPDLIKLIPEAVDIKEIEKRVTPVFEKACKSMVKMRQGEGARLIEDLRQRLDELKEMTLRIISITPERQKEYLEKTRKRIDQLLENRAEPDEGRLLTELGILSEKLDITEETVRLNAHIEVFSQTITGQSAPGKKLVFILQEMLREVNTLGTKCQNIEIQHICVNMKDVLEKIREQAQNIE